VEIGRKLATPYSEVRVIALPPFGSPERAIDVVTSSAAAVIASLEAEI